MCTSRPKLSCSWICFNFLTQNTWAYHCRRQPSPTQQKRPPHQLNHQILKPQSTKSIQKYNTTNPNKKNLQLTKTHLKQTNPANPAQACARSGQGDTHISFCEDLCNLLEAKTTTTKLIKPVHTKSSMKLTKGNCEEKEKVEKSEPWGKMREETAGFRSAAMAECLDRFEGEIFGS